LEGLDERIILEWILNRVENYGMDSSDSRQGPVVAVVNVGMNIWVP